MTRDQAKDFLPLVKAYAEGKDLELYHEKDQRWYPDPSPNFFQGMRYRINSKYRPFQTAEECVEEINKHFPVGRIKKKWEFCEGISTDKPLVCEAKLKDDKIVLSLVIEYDDMDDLLKKYTFADGEPFGVRVDEEDNECEISNQ